MRKYRYSARRQGVDAHGVIDAESKAEAARLLKAEGYEAIRIKKAASDTNKLFRRFFSR